MGIKNFIFQKALKAKLKDVPKEQADMIMRIMERNPELMQKIASEIKEATKKGQDEQMATFSVMQKYKSELEATVK